MARNYADLDITCRVVGEESLRTMVDDIHIVLDSNDGM